MRNNVPLQILAAMMTGVLLLWEAAASYNPQLRFVLPAPSAIISELLSRPELFLSHSLATLRVMLSGFLCALMMAFPLAWSMSAYAGVNRLVQPVLVVLKCIPMFALAPIMVLWCGWSLTALVIPTALMVFIPLTLSLYSGLTGTPTSLLEYFQLNGASSWQSLTKLRLPWAMPQLFAGLRISSAMAGMGAVAGEWAGAQRGLGVLMLESRVDAELSTTFAALLCLTVLTLALYGSVVLCEAICVRRVRRSRYLLLFPVLLASVLITVHEERAIASEQVPVRMVLDWHPNPNHVPLYVALEEGYFKEAGLDVQLLRLRDPADGIPLLSSGSVDLAVSYTPTTVKAWGEGAQVDIVATLIPCPLNCVMFRAGSNPDGVQGLAGKTIGYCSGSRGATVLQALLGDAGVVPGQLRNVSFDLTAALGTELVEAVYGGYWNIESEQLSDRGLQIEWLPVQQLGMPEYAELVLLAARDGMFADEHKRAALVSALERGFDYCRRKPNQAFELYAKRQEKSSQTLAWERRSWLATLELLKDAAPPADETLTELIQWYAEHDLARRS